MVDWISKSSILCDFGEPTSDKIVAIRYELPSYNSRFFYPQLSTAKSNPL